MRSRRLINHKNILKRPKLCLEATFSAQISRQFASVERRGHVAAQKMLYRKRVLENLQGDSIGGRAFGLVWLFFCLASAWFSLDKRKPRQSQPNPQESPCIVLLECDM